MNINVVRFPNGLFGIISEHYAGDKKVKQYLSINSDGKTFYWKYSDTAEASCQFTRFKLADAMIYVMGNVKSYQDINLNHQIIHESVRGNEIFSVVNIDLGFEEQYGLMKITKDGNINHYGFYVFKNAPFKGVFAQTNHQDFKNGNCCTTYEEACKEFLKFGCAPLPQVSEENVIQLASQNKLPLWKKVLGFR